MRKTDAALLERWVTVRDPEAFSEIVERHAGMVSATCRRVLGNGADAEEATQDCFLKLSQADRASVHSLGGWLHRMATNRALDRLRSDTRRVAREKAYTDERPTSVEPVWDDIQPHVDAIIAELPEDLQAPLVLHFFGGYSHREVGKALGLSRSAVTGRIQRAIGAIREQLDARGVTVGLAALTLLFEAYEVQAASPSLVVSLNKIGLAAGRPTATALVPLGGKLGLAAATVVIAATVLWSALFRESNSDEVAASMPETVTEAPEVSAREPVLVETYAEPAATEDEPAEAAEPEPTNTLRLRCVDASGKPVASAELYYVRHDRSTAPMMEHDRPEDSRRTPYGPVVSDTDGYVHVPEVDEGANRHETYYSAYARIPDKLVGAWIRYPGFPKQIGWDTITLVRSRRISGMVTVPAGFEPTQVTVDLLSLRIQTSGKGFGALFTASAKYHPPLWPELFSTKPAPDGTFILGDIPAGQDYFLEFTAPGLGEAQYSNLREDGDSPISINMAREATISGTIRYATGGPAVDVPVFARPILGRDRTLNVTTSFQARTDTLGRYTIKGLPRARYSIKVQHFGEPPTWISPVIPELEVASGASTREIDITIERGALQEGIVVDEESGEPVPGAWLAAMNGGSGDGLSQGELIGTSQTDSEGKFAFRLPAGMSYLYFFSVEREYVSPADQGKTFVAVEPGEAFKPALNFTLAKRSEAELAPPREATIEGRVFDHYGRAIPSVPISIDSKYKVGDSERSRLPFSLETDDEGRFSTTVLVRGEYKLTTGGQRFSRVESEWFTVDPDEPSVFPDLIVEPYVHSISVTVTNFSDSPDVSRPYVSVSAKDTGDRIAGGSVDESGHIEFWVPNVPLKGYTGQRGSKTVDFEIEPGAAIEVRLEPSDR